MSRSRAQQAHARASVDGQPGSRRSAVALASRAKALSERGEPRCRMHTLAHARLLRLAFHFAAEVARADRIVLTRSKLGSAARVATRNASIRRLFRVACCGRGGFRLAFIMTPASCEGKEGKDEHSRGSLGAHRHWVTCARSGPSPIWYFQSCRPLPRLQRSARASVRSRGPQAV